jgi:hypothetical protein
MRKIEEIGTCPGCDCSLFMFKTKNRKRFVKCEICGLSYPLPQYGQITTSGLVCSKKKYPILIVQKKDQKAYFWADGPCFSCVEEDRCQEIKDLVEEFKELEIYGYKNKVSLNAF